MENNSIFDLISQLLGIDMLVDKSDVNAYDARNNEFEKITMYSFFNHLIDSYNKFMNNVDDDNNIVTNTEPNEIPKWAKVTPSD